MLRDSVKRASIVPIVYFGLGALHAFCIATVFNLLFPNEASRVILENLGQSLWLLPALLLHDLFIHAVLSLPAAVLIVYFSKAIAFDRCVYFLVGVTICSYSAVLIELDFAFFAHWQVLLNTVLLLLPLVWAYLLSRKLPRRTKTP